MAEKTKLKEKTKMPKCQKWRKRLEKPENLKMADKNSPQSQKCPNLRKISHEFSFHARPFVKL